MFVAVVSAFYYAFYTSLQATFFIKFNPTSFTSKKQRKSLKIKAKMKNIWFGVFAFDWVNMYINYT